MANYQHPGVYIQEIPGTRGIQGISTSTAAFIGVTDTGPLNTPTLITSWNAYIRQFGGLVWMGFNAWAVYEFFQEGGSACYVVRADDKTGVAATGTLGTVKIAAATHGSWGASLMYHVGNGTGLASGGTPATPIFHLQVVVQASAIDGTAPETLSSQLLVAYVRQNGLVPVNIGGAGYYVLETFDGLTCLDAATVDRINGQSIFIRLTLGSPMDSQRPADTSTPTALSGGIDGELDFGSAQEAIRTLQDLSLLAQPDTAAIVDASGKSDVVRQAQAIQQGMQLCEDLTRVFYVADPPFGQSVPQMIAFKSGDSQAQGEGQAIDSSYGSLYYPWTWIRHSLSGASVPMPPSGPVLGRFAFTDASIGVWKSPAGVGDGNMQTVVALERPLTDADQDQLNPDGINALRNLSNYGNVIWGARTVSPDPKWTYLSVRRLVIFVEQSLKTSLQWVVFEANAASLWAVVTRDVEAFLTTLWQQGALFGATAGDACFVVCDASNNPPETRATGQLCIDIGLAAIRPSEFIDIRIVQQTADADSGG